jgi:Helix-turn-helix domain
MTSLQRPAGADPVGDGGDAAPVGAPAATGPADDPAAGSVAGSVADFAAQLRELRDRAGHPSYRQLARLAHYSHTALSQAAAGHSLPSLAVTQAFVRACDGNVEEWSARWREVDKVVRSPGEPLGRPVPRPAPGPARPGSGWRAAGWLRVKGGVAAAGIAATTCIAAVALWYANSATVTSSAGHAPLRLQVESSGLYVRYAAVTNLGTRAGYAYVLNTGAGKVHRSPRPVPPGQSWTYFFDRDLKGGVQICGSIDLGPATCTRVRA